MRHLLLYTFLFFHLHASSHEYSVIIGGPFDDALYDVAQDYGDSIAVAGFSQHFDPAPQEPETYYSAFDYLEAHHRAHGEQIALKRLDGTGNVIFEKTFGLPEFNRAVSLLKTPDNGYAVGGYTQAGQLLLARLDHFGNVRFLQRFGTANTDTMHRLVALRDGGVLAVGSSVASRNAADPYFRQGLGGNDIFLTRFSKNGATVWSRKYGGTFDDTGIDAAEAEDGSLVVLGTTDHDGKRRAMLLRLDENGDRLWSKEYESGTSVNAYDLLSLGNGRFMASLGVTASDNREQIRLLTFDLQQTVFQDRNVSTSNSSALYALARYANGSVVGVGASASAGRDGTDALAMRFDSHGALLWEKRYSAGNYGIFRNLAVLRDGTVAAVGTHVAVGSETENMWVVKLYDDGTPVSTSASESSLYENLARTFSDDILKGNVTLGKDLSISLSHPVLLFEAGVYTLTPVQETFLERFSAKLLKALQPHKRQIAELRINGHTSSEWRGAGFTDRYLNNAELSTQRAFSVLSHIFRTEANTPYRPWLTDILSNNGYSYAKIVKTPDEDRKASRRVVFEVIVK